MKIIFIFLIACGGYSGKELVLVAPDDDVENMDVSGFTGLDMVHLGTHVWDDVGSHFRTQDELNTIPHWNYDGHMPSVLHIHSMITPVVNMSAYYTTPIDGIRIDKDAMQTYDPVCVRDIIAHEIGHAMGLQHSTDCNALMAGTPYCTGPLACNGLTQTDVQMYRTIWGE